MNKLNRYYQTIPSLYNPKANRILNGLLQAWAQEDELIDAQIIETKNQLFVDTAEQKYLDFLASNDGIDRPPLIALSDVYFRDLIKAMSFAPKQVKKTMYDVLDVFWGPLYSRANITCVTLESYNLGAYVGISGTVSFTNNTAIVNGHGTFFTSELTVGNYIKLITENQETFVQITRIINDTELIIAAPYTGKTKTGAVHKYEAKTLLIQVDDGVINTVGLSPVYFINPLTVSADEISNAINTELSTVTTEKIRELDSTLSYVNVRTNTTGSTGSIQITGGTANTILNFPTTRHTVADIERSTLLYEINPRELIIKIPNLVAKLQRALEGAFHIHDNYTGEVVSIDVAAKTITVNFDRPVLLNQLAGLYFAHSKSEFLIVSHPAGQMGVVIQLDAGVVLTDLWTQMVYSTDVALTTWTVNHALGQKYVNFEFYDDTLTSVFPDTVTAVDNNTTVATFYLPTKGKAIMIKDRVFAQTTPSALWTIHHNLGMKYVNIVIYDGADQLVIPEKIKALSDNSLEIKFASPQTGKVALSVDFTYTPVTPKPLWIVEHNYNTTAIHATVYDNVTDEVIFTDAVVGVNTTTAFIEFSIPQMGTAAVGRLIDLGFAILNPNYTNSYVYDSKQNYQVSKQRAVLAQAIHDGSVYGLIEVDDSSNIPNTPGFLIFDFGLVNEEKPISYTSRPNNNQIMIDPTYVFNKNHVAGAMINFLPHLYVYSPRTNGSDYAVYATGVKEALAVVQSILEKIKAAGVIIRYVIYYPEYPFTSAEPNV